MGPETKPETDEDDSIVIRKQLRDGAWAYEDNGRGVKGVISAGNIEFASHALAHLMSGIVMFDFYGIDMYPANLQTDGVQEATIPIYAGLMKPAVKVAMSVAQAEFLHQQLGNLIADDKAYRRKLRQEEEAAERQDGVDV
jgi:hypothetical protein